MIFQKPLLSSQIIDRRYDQLAFYDCINSIAYALLQRNIQRISDKDYALLRQAFQEIILLVKQGQFLDGRKDVCQAIDAYLLERLRDLGQEFSGQRSKWQRLLIDIYLLMRDRCLELVDHLLKITHALFVLKTPEELKIWDEALAEWCLKDIQSIKDTYLLIDRFPTHIAMPSLSSQQQKQMAAFIGLHPPSQEIPFENYISGNIQMFFLHNLVQTTEMLTKLPEIPLLSLPELQSLPKQMALNAAASIDESHETTAECLIEVMEISQRSSPTYEDTMTPAMLAIATTDSAVSISLNLISQLPRTRKAKINEELRTSIKKHHRWHQYRLHWLANRYNVLIS